MERLTNFFNWLFAGEQPIKKETDDDLALPTENRAERLREYKKYSERGFLALIFSAAVLFLGFALFPHVSLEQQIFYYTIFPIAGLILFILIIRNVHLERRQYTLYYQYLYDIENHRSDLLTYFAQKKGEALDKVPWLNTATIDGKREWIRTRALDPRYHPTNLDRYTRDDVDTFFKELIAEASRAF